MRRQARQCTTGLRAQGGGALRRLRFERCKTRLCSAFVRRGRTYLAMSPCHCLCIMMYSAVRAPAWAWSGRQGRGKSDAAVFVPFFLFCVVIHPSPWRSHACQKHILLDENLMYELKRGGICKTRPRSHFKRRKWATSPLLPSNVLIMNPYVFPR